MTSTLIHGTFSKKDAQALVTLMIESKIRFHQSKIDPEEGEETIKMRENRIIKLQNDLVNWRTFLQEYPGDEISLDSKITSESNA